MCIVVILCTCTNTIVFGNIPCGSDGKESTWNVEDPGSIPGPEDPLEKGMATQSCILVWGILWSEEPGELQSMGSQRMGHD